MPIFDCRPIADQLNREGLKAVALNGDMPQKERDAIMAEILKYNEEDLAATWAVLEWLRGDHGA